MKKNTIKIVGVLMVILMVVLYVDGQNRLIREAKSEMDLMDYKIELQKEQIEKEKNYRSEIEQVKEEAEINKSNIVENKSNFEEAKRVVLGSKSNWEQSVWLGRCLDEKLVDLTTLCEEDLERFADYGLGK